MSPRQDAPGGRQQHSDRSNVKSATDLMSVTSRMTEREEFLDTRIKDRKVVRQCPLEKDVFGLAWVARFGAYAVVPGIRMAGSFKVRISKSFSIILSVVALVLHFVGYGVLFGIHYDSDYFSTKVKTRDAKELAAVLKEGFADSPALFGARFLAVCIFTSFSLPSLANRCRLIEMWVMEQRLVWFADVSMLSRNYYLLLGDCHPQYTEQQLGQLDIANAWEWVTGFVCLLINLVEVIWIFLFTYGATDSIIRATDVSDIFITSVITILVVKYLDRAVLHLFTSFFDMIIGPRCWLFQLAERFEREREVAELRSTATGKLCSCFGASIEVVIGLIIREILRLPIGLLFAIAFSPFIRFGAVKLSDRLSQRGLTNEDEFTDFIAWALTLSIVLFGMLTPLVNRTFGSVKRMAKREIVHPGDAEDRDEDNFSIVTNTRSRPPDLMTEMSPYSPLPSPRWPQDDAMSQTSRTSRGSKHPRQNRPHAKRAMPLTEPQPTDAEAPARAPKIIIMTQDDTRIDQAIDNLFTSAPPKGEEGGAAAAVAGKAPAELDIFAYESSEESD
ncbi:unnamed protein product [Vitrella brassicaformis CCMP3155]|uniref:Uncharacterized protein n=2 Tax=Vitrella brassicaformis TaxID=1169539 RepID=A0A0G4GHQ0_VITBC|nr:unnamed protein product [Vitrella brassicaformis CCMP3155]|mmetsp:Transcript_4507/g.10450  ORF Transcript_4507/g.10450 Transcript_4507/m.10450 type:complete len:559 (+) Transcript_4507:138-1814(+)|eukprot:CEM29253.1 unnamed protein product [Vitrella brassicaformis CCMP3155]